MATALRQQKYPFGSLRTDPHWSVQGLVFCPQFKPAEKLIDETSYKNHGTITGATWVRGGLKFVNNTDDVNLGTGIRKLTLSTIVVRFAPSDWADGGLAIHSHDTGAAVSAWGILVRDTGDAVECWVSTGAANQQWVAASNWNAGGFPANVFTTVAMVIDGTNLTYYRDGVYQNSTAQTEVNSGTVYDFHLGILGTVQAFAFSGIISDVKIYNRALSATEIAELYINPDLPFQQYPAWWGKTPAVVGANPKGPLGYPLFGPFAGPITC